MRDKANARQLLVTCFFYIEQLLNVILSPECPAFSSSLSMKRAMDNPSKDFLPISCVRSIGQSNVYTNDTVYSSIRVKIIL